MKKTTEFPFDGKTYVIEADWDKKVGTWYSKDNPSAYSNCWLADPGYYIASIEEMPLQVASLFTILQTEDHAKMGSFLLRFNAALRTILPPDASVYREVSPKFADFV